MPTPTHSKETWTDVDTYITSHLLPSDPILDESLASAVAAGLPAIQVSPAQGRFLHLLARSCGAQKILEIGTLAGYSTIHLARALPPTGRLITLEFNPKHADVARANFARANLSDLIDLRVGPALESLPSLQPLAPFDLIFIDADKPNIPAYLTHAISLSRPGTLILIDNVIRDGALIDPQFSDPGIMAIRQMFQMLSTDKRLTATTLQTVGSKGYDGLTIAIVN